MWGDIMKVSYKKLWVLCAENEMSKADLRRAALGFDALVAGSDQIWSPVWLNPAYFLNFTARPKVSYAPSLGVQELKVDRKEFSLHKIFILLDKPAENS